MIYGLIEGLLSVDLGIRLVKGLFETGLVFMGWLIACLFRVGFMVYGLFMFV